MRRRTFVRATLGAAALAAPLTRLIAADQPAQAGVAAVKLSGQSTRIERKALDELSRGLHGKLFVADSPEYDAIRRIWNA